MVSNAVVKGRVSSWQNGGDAVESCQGVGLVYGVISLVGSNCS